MDDVEAIKQLKARYFRLMDTRDWEGWGALFTEDAVLAASPDPQEQFAGRAEIVRRVRSALAEAVTVHHGHMPEIVLTAPDRAEGIWAMDDFVELPQLVLRGSGHYHDRYRKRDGRWLIQESRLSRLRLELEPKRGTR